MLEPPRDVSRLSSMAPHLDDAPESGHDDPFRKAGVGPHWGHNWRGSDGTRGDRRDARPRFTGRFVLIVPGSGRASIGLENRWRYTKPSLSGRMPPPQ
jgi:hypothetical protein